MQPDDAYWRRPQAPDEPAPISPVPAGSGYSGPPPSTPPSADWAPAFLVEPAPPRDLPAQDEESIDSDEDRARRVTLIVAAVAGALMLIMSCALCVRLLR